MRWILGGGGFELNIIKRAFVGGVVVAPVLFLDCTIRKGKNNFYAGFDLHSFFKSVKKFKSTWVFFYAVNWNENKNKSVLKSIKKLISLNFGQRKETHS